MSLTVNEAWGMFVTERSISLCPTTLTSDYRQVSQWLKRCPHQDFTEGRKVLTWVLQQKPVRASRRVAMYVKSLYRWASQEDVDLILKNPIQTFRMPKAPQSDDEIIVIPRSEVALLLIALKYKKTYRNVDWSLYAEFMLQTAMRTGEVRALKWTDIKDNKVIVHSNYTLTHGLKNSTKTNKKRVVPLNNRCLEILDEVPKDNDFIFPWDRMAFQSFFNKRAKTLHEADLASKCYRPYDLRHTAISRWIEAHIPVTQVASWAGNTSEVIWKHYANTTTEYEVPVL